jgi:hypothetical protein
MTNIPYALYDNRSGQIIATGEADPRHLHLEVREPFHAIAPGPASERDWVPLPPHASAGRITPRPEVPMPTLETWGLDFASGLPPEATVKITSDFVEIEFLPEARRVAFDIAQTLTVEITAPFPWISSPAFTHEVDGTAPDDPAQIAHARLDLVQAHFADLVITQEDALIQAMLGHPTPAQVARHRLKRDMLARHRAGTLTPADEAALAESIRYEKGAKVEEELSAIAKAVAFEDWVTLRADGVRRKALADIDAAQDLAAVFAAVTWAEGESAAAVAEATAKS